MEVAHDAEQQQQTSDDEANLNLLAKNAVTSLPPKKNKAVVSWEKKNIHLGCKKKKE